MKAWITSISDFQISTFRPLLSSLLRLCALCDKSISPPAFLSSRFHNLFNYQLSDAVPDFLSSRSTSAVGFLFPFLRS